MNIALIGELSRMQKLVGLITKSWDNAVVTVYPTTKAFQEQAELRTVCADRILIFDNQTGVSPKLRQGIGEFKDFLDAEAGYASATVVVICKANTVASMYSEYFYDEKSIIIFQAGAFRSLDVRNFSGLSLRELRTMYKEIIIGVVSTIPDSVANSIGQSKTVRNSDNNKKWGNSKQLDGFNGKNNNNFEPLENQTFEPISDGFTGEFEETLGSGESIFDQNFNLNNENSSSHLGFTQATNIFGGNDNFTDNSYDPGGTLNVDFEPINDNRGNSGNGFTIPITGGNEFEPADNGYEPLTESNVSFEEAPNNSSDFSFEEAPNNSSDFSFEEASNSDSDFSFEDTSSGFDFGTDDNGFSETPQGVSFEEAPSSNSDDNFGFEDVTNQEASDGFDTTTNSSDFGSSDFNTDTSGSFDFNDTDNNNDFWSDNQSSEANDNDFTGDSTNQETYNNDNVFGFEEVTSDDFEAQKQDDVSDDFMSNLDGLNDVGSMFGGFGTNTKQSVVKTEINGNKHSHMIHDEEDNEEMGLFNRGNKNNGGNGFNQGNNDFAQIDDGFTPNNNRGNSFTPNNDYGQHSGFNSNPKGYNQSSGNDFSDFGGSATFTPSQPEDILDSFDRDELTRSYEQERQVQQNSIQPQVIVAPQVVNNTGMSKYNAILAKQMSQIIVVTGDRRSGKTTTAMDIAAHFASKRIKTLYVDFDTEFKGSLIHYNISNLASYPAMVTSGLIQARSGADIEKFVYRQNGIPFDSLISIYDTNVTDAILQEVQLQLAYQVRNYGCIVIDCPLDKLYTLDEVLAIANVFCCIPSDLGGLVATFMKFSSLEPDGNYRANDNRKLLSPKSIAYLYPRMQYLVRQINSKDNFAKQCEYINGLFDMDRDRYNWTRCKIGGYMTDITKVLQNML